MMKSILLHLESAAQAAPVIEVGVNFAREAKARIRGLTLVDTRAETAADNCESAGYLSLTHTRQAIAERLHEQAHSELTKACLRARLNFDVRRTSGNPIVVLPAESPFHDLTITSLAGRLEFPQAATLTRRDVLKLVRRGVQPLLMLPPVPREIVRVLLVYDGSPESGRAIRTFLNFGVLRKADYRLLAIGGSEDDARARLSEMAEYCAEFCRRLETGCVVGRSNRVVLPYAQKWEADLLVTGVNGGAGWLSWVFGQRSIDLAHALGCGVLVQA